MPAHPRNVWPYQEAGMARSRMWAPRARIPPLRAPHPEPPGEERREQWIRLRRGGRMTWWIHGNRVVLDRQPV